MKIMPMSVNQNNSRNYSMRKADPNFTSTVKILDGLKNPGAEQAVKTALKNHCVGGAGYSPFFIITPGEESIVTGILTDLSSSFRISFAFTPEGGKAAKNILGS